MPQLRSGVRRARAAPVTNKESEPPKKNKPGRGRPRTRLAAKKSEPLTQLLIPETLKNVVEEGVGVMGDERVGVSANKDKGVAAVPEEDANSPPLPERVCADFDTIFCIGYIYLCDGS